MAAALIPVGVLLLYLGGELLVKNASLLARALGLSPLVVGLTVVAFGTSSPELAASLAAALRGAPEVAFGNVVGSNAANLGLILALAALIRPIRAQARFLRRELPFMVAVAGLLIAVAADGRVSRLEGGLLLFFLLLYLFVLLRDREVPEVEAEYAAEYGRAARFFLRRLCLLALGVFLLALGSSALVDGAVALARTLGVGERAIGLTVVAVGTSLPELAAALVAALRREGDILLGNVVGSNIFNVLGILGTVAAVRPLTLAGGVGPDLLGMAGLSLLAWAFLWTGMRLGRREAAVLLAFYLLYVGAVF